MCTILFLHRVHPEMSLVVAANRDEHYARPSEPPALRALAPRIVAGLDRRAGGTWLGVNEHGLLVGITNQRTYAPPDSTKRSRGAVVLDALDARSVLEVVDKLQRLAPDDFNPFNLLIGDGETLVAAYARTGSEHIEVEVAPEGVHVLPNDRIGADGFPKARRAAQLASRFVSTPWPALVPALASVLGDHELPDIREVTVPPAGSSIDLATAHRAEAICLHGTTYGTCSSSIVALRPRQVAHYLHAQGAPCTTPFAEVTSRLG